MKSDINKKELVDFFKKSKETSVSSILKSTAKTYDLTIKEVLSIIKEYRANSTNIKEIQLIDAKIQQYNLELKKAYNKYYVLFMKAYDQNLDLNKAIEDVCTNSKITKDILIKRAQIYISQYSTSDERIQFMSVRKRRKSNKNESFVELINVADNVCINDIFTISKNDTIPYSNKITMIKYYDANIIKDAIDKITNYYLRKISSLSNVERILAIKEKNQVLEVLSHCYSRPNYFEGREHPSVKIAHDKKLSRAHEAEIAIISLINSGLRSSEFKEKYKLGSNYINFMSEILKETNLPLYESFVQYDEQADKKYYDELTDTIALVADKIMNGVEIGENQKRAFTILDYYSITNIPLRTIYSYERTHWTLEPNGHGAINYFVTHNAELHLDRTALLNCHELKMINGQMREFTSEEKESLINYLEMNNLPVNVASYNALLNEYLNNRVFIEKAIAR